LVGYSSACCIRGASLFPDEAFAALGNEIRMEMLRALGDADGTLSFSELYDRLDAGDSGQFTNRLDKLLAHYVRKTDE
jgi:DNA-binding transcriptional ArsR family regulator